MVAVFLGMLLAKLLSVAGIGTFIASLFIRSYAKVVLAAAVFATVDTLLLSMVSVTGLRPASWVFAMIAALLAGTAGWFIRGRRI